MEQIISILEDIQPDIDYETVTDLIDGNYLLSIFCCFSVFQRLSFIRHNFDMVNIKQIE